MICPKSKNQETAINCSELVRDRRLTGYRTRQERSIAVY